jgi:hypothetical protein
MVIDLDPTGVTAQYFTPQVQSFYDLFNVSVLKIRGSNHQLPSAMKSAHRAGHDILETIRELPDDSRKFMVLMQMGMKTDPDKYRPLLLACAEKADDTEVIAHGMNLFPKDPKFRAHYFHRLSEILSVWINELLKHQSVADPVVNRAYQPLQELMKLFSDDVRAKIFATVRERQDLTQALAMLVRKGVIDTTRSDPMVADIMNIVRPCLSV